jgi:polar amino acid transport system substrate-binding protein
MDLDRRTFYEKELELRMSMSYGPGRYDRRYEEMGLDYPVAYVRWTEQRNLQAFIDLAAKGSVDPNKMDLETVEFEKATETYEALAKGERKALAAVFQYSEDVDSSRSQHLGVAGRRREARGHATDLGLAVIGAGNYAKGVLLPILKNASGLAYRSVVTSTGPSSQRTAERFGFEACGTDPSVVFADSSVDLVLVTTRHDSHAVLAEAALRAGKAVWLEKPVGLSGDEVDAVAKAARDSDGFLMVGYNRRFSSHAIAIREAFANRQAPMAIQYVIVAGPAPSGTWIVDPVVGGGRVIGEVCHFVDLCAHLVGQSVSQVWARALGRDAEVDDSMMAMLSFPDGSTAQISYLANASPELPKERFEVHAEGKSAVCDNFRTTILPGGKKVRGVNQDKGQERAVRETLEALRAGAPSPIPLSDLVATSRTTFGILESIRTGTSVGIVE